MTTTIDRLHQPELRRTLGEALAAIALEAGPDQLASVAIACVEGHLTQAAPRRLFTAAHLGLVYLLAEQAGATHVRLRRLWDAKAARPRNPWPWISDSGIRTRCSELVAWGLVEDTGARGESPTGRPSTIWSLVGVDPRTLGRDVEPIPGVDASAAERLEALLEEAGDDVLVRAQLQLAATVAGIVL